MRHRLMLAALLSVGLLLTPMGAEGATTPKQAGVSFVGTWAGAFDGTRPEQAMAELKSTDAGWVSIIVTQYQADISSTSIAPTDSTPTDTGLIHMIDVAHAMGLKVMLKPHVDLSNDSSHSRNQIGTTFGTDREKWKAWFTTYATMIWHYADLAKANGVEQFAVGTELTGTTKITDGWRKIVAGVRQRYAGKITYASTVGGEENRIQWWDAVDYIGLDAYYPLTTSDDPTLQALKDAWSSKVSGLSRLSSKWGKPIVFTEIGYRSVNGANKAPHDWRATGDVDLQEQADCYQAALSVMWNQPWLAGMYWWSWRAEPLIGGSTDSSFTPNNKPAEDVLRTYY